MNMRVEAFRKRMLKNVFVAVIAAALAAYEGGSLSSLSKFRAMPRLRGRSWGLTARLENARIPFFKK